VRPVLLEMDGFASFRQPTTLSFDDADYFALIGATGSGKSTVVDAITFALYGSVARWDKENMVSPALAPTANRGTVKLVFDARGQRYIAMRELRRSGSTGQVNVRTARLERLIDPSALGGPDDEVEILADQRSVKKAVDELLGLDFNQFTKCVALPQGDVAEFLHAPAADRQRILTKLLGIEIYQRIGHEAGSRATHQETVAETLDSNIARYPSAGEGALTAASARVAELKELAAYLKQALPSLAAAVASSAAAQLDVERIESDSAVLAATSKPVDVGELEARRSAAESGLAEATTKRSTAEAADLEARTQLNALPTRASLEALASKHGQLAAASDELPVLIVAAGEAIDTREKLAAQAKEQTVKVKTLAAMRESAVSQHQHALQALTAASDRLSLLESAHAPEGLASLAEQIFATNAKKTEADDLLQRSRTAYDLACTRRDGVGDLVAIDRAKTSLTNLQRAVEAGSADLAVAKSTRTRALAVAHARTDAQTAAHTAEAILAATRHANTAISLRAELIVGRPCPVCEQDVRLLPAPDDTTTLSDAESTAIQAMSAFEAAADLAQSVEKEAYSARTAALSALKLASQSHASAVAALKPILSIQLPPFAVKIDDVAEQLAPESEANHDSVDTTMDALAGLLSDAEARALAVNEAHSVANDAAAVVKTTQATLRAAEVDVEKLRSGATALAQEVAAARDALVEARDVLVPVGAPAIENLDPVSGWDQLLAWADAETSTKQGELPALRATAASCEGTLLAAQQEAANAESRLTKIATNRDVAIDAAAGAVTTRDLAGTNVESLTAELVGQPTRDAVETQLAEVGRWEAAAQRADRELQAAREERRHAEVSLGTLEAEVITARGQLNAARDKLVVFGVPPIEQASLEAAWAALIGWAKTELNKRVDQLTTSLAKAEDTANFVSEAETLLRGKFALYALPDLPSPVAESAPASLASAQASAGAAVERVLEQQTTVREMQARSAEARIQAQVARALATLLRASGLPQWLTTNALKVLVSTASQTLLDLTGGQFELSSDHSGFQIVDHHDADSVRGVKTLSGGETFQAALALALALSSQLGMLSATGAAQLEAIFIDEGFGTLDEVTLDTVASTLENLASSGGRMVGVITHVPGLASRVPVRFVVNRDANGSHVEREGE
jgi:DNA repair protein SbcC/Rad50